MKTINLVKKPAKFNGQFGATAGSPSNPDGQQWDNYFNAADDNPNLQFIRICCWFNNDIECYSDCWYIHICNECKKKEHMEKNYKKKWFIDNSKMNIFLFIISEFFSYFFIDTSAFFLTGHGSLWTEEWKKRLQNHLNKLYINIFYKIITHEARIDYTGSKQWIINLNLQFAKKVFEILTKNIENQQTHDHIFCLKSISKHIIIFFFKLAFKFNNKWQKIHHLFYSFKKSVNNNIFKIFETIKYTSVDKTIEKISDLRSETMLIKRNLANAFRHVPVAKTNWWLLEFKWQKQCWINWFLFFELKTFSFLFDLFVKNIN